MRKQTIFHIIAVLVIASLLCIAGCIKEPPCNRPEDTTQKPDTTAQSIVLRFEPSLYTEGQTKSGDGVRDINLFLQNTHTGDTHRFFTQSSGIAASLAPGDYDLLALANAGGDLSALTMEQIQAFTLTAGVNAPESQSPMIARQSVTLGGGDPITVKLERCYAMVDLDISIDPALGGA